jgi:hypothetical protein
MWLRWIFAAVVAVGGLAWAVDKLQKPPSECEANELGCALVTQLKDEGVIDGFEFVDPESGDITTVEINDNDSFLLHMGATGYEFEYPEDEEALVNEMDAVASKYRPPRSELAELP